MSDFKPGEMVDITIKGARVVRSDECGVTVDFAPADEFATHVSFPWGPDLLVERVAPAEWPPQPGDLWRDHDGNLWFVLDRPDHSTPHFRSPADSIAPGDYIAAHHGPLTLVHREEPGHE